MHSNEGATSQSHSKLLRECVERCVAMFLFLSPCLFTAHPAINRSHSAEASLSARVALWQQPILDGGWLVKVRVER